MRFEIPLPTVKDKPGTGVTPGPESVCDLPVGPKSGFRYFGFLLQLGTSTGNKVVADYLANLRLVADGRDLWHLHGGQIAYLDDFNGVFNKYQSAAGQPFYWMIHMSQPWRRSSNAEDAFALGTADLEQLQLQMKWNANLAETPSFAGIALVDEEVAANGPYTGQRFPVGLVKCVRQNTLSPSGSGLFQYKISKGARIQRLHLFSDKVDRVVIRYGIRTIFDRTKAQNDAIQKLFGLSPVSTVYTIAFDYTQRWEDFFDIRGGAELILDIYYASGVTSHQLVTEYIGDKMGE